jgi:gentisate 1,2-dioxygenase
MPDNESSPEALLVDCSNDSFAANNPEQFKPASDWPPILIPRETIEREIERLADLPRPANGLRRTLFVHPSAPTPGRGLNPGVQVSLDVLKPGEETVPVRHNSTQVNFCIQGSGSCSAGERHIEYGQYDVWNHPSFVTYRHVNNSKQLHARLTYSNAALLEMMRVHLVEIDPGADPVRTGGGDVTDDPRRTSPFGTFEIGNDGAMLMPYERLINPPPVKSPVLHWPWPTVEENLIKLGALGKDYIGRRLYLLYNPMTERFNGITPNFFATFTIRPPGIVDRPHRHVSSSINYYFSGSGFSVVAGQRYRWKAGDLQVSAPGWAVHNHASDEGDPVYELTVQDQPLTIYMEALLWQESLKEPMTILGTNPGFTTNRADQGAP